LLVQSSESNHQLVIELLGTSNAKNSKKKGTNFVIGLIKEKIREYQMSSKKAKDVQIQEQSKFLTN